MIDKLSNDSILSLIHVDLLHLCSGGILKVQTASRISRGIISVYLGLIFTVLFLVTSAQAMPPQPELLEQLKQSGQLDKFAERLADAKARGVCQPLTRDTKAVEQKALALDPNAVDTFRVIVILADFSDNEATGGMVSGTVADFEHLLFSFDSTDNHYSMAEFYFDNSYGNFYLEGVVAGWYRLPQTYAYYVDGLNGFGSYPQNAQRMAEDAITAADPTVDFSQFDNDGDGWCDGVFVVHAGVGAESSGSDNHIWSHAWSTSYTMSIDGISVRSYTTEPEELSGSLITQGVFSHEYGHFLGLPDLYDTDYSSSGIGDWSLMAGGSWNVSGRYPAFFDPWCKKEVGFLTPQNITTNQTNVEIPSSYHNPVVYRLWANGVVGNEYFLIENRRDIENDFGIPGSGLLIYHIDESQWGNSEEPHYLVAVEQADGEFDLENDNNQGDAGDLWSTLTKTEFTDLTTPNTKDYNSVTTQTAVWNISAPDSVMFANFDISYSRPKFIFNTSSFSDAAFGNNNGVVEPGETITFTFDLSNLWLTASNVTASMTSDNPDITFSTSSVNIGAVLGEGGTGDNSSQPLVFDVPATFDPCIDSFYLELTSDNPYGNENYGFELHIGTPEVLVIDDDNGASWDQALTNSLRNLRIPFDLYDKSTMGSPAGALLSQYKIVMWLTGDDRTDILSAADVTAMKDFMDNGGKFFLTGQSIVGELASDDPSFLSNYLKANFDANMLYPLIFGIAGTEVGDTLKIRFDSFTNQTDPCKMTIAAGGTAEFEIPVGGVMGISHVGSYTSLLFSFGFEAISENYTSIGYVTKDSMLTRIMNFFDYGDVNKPSNPSVDALTLSGEVSVDAVVNHTPIFNWNFTDTTGGSQTQYQVQVGTGNLCFNSNDMWDTGVLSGSDVSIAYDGLPLYDGQSYFLRVRTYNGTEWSSWRRISFTMNQVADPVTPLEPVNDTIVATTQPDLTVTNVLDPNGDILTYNFEVYSDSALTSLVTSITGVSEGSGTTAWTVDTPLPEDSRVFWRSRPFDGYESSSFSATASFLVNAVNQAPSAFTLVTPADSASNTGLTPTFIWQSSTDSDLGDQITYTLMVAEDPAFTTSTDYTELTDTTYALATLDSNTIYFWQVKAIDMASSETVSGDINVFSTGTFGCCTGIRGNIDNDPGDNVDVSDLLYLVDFMFLVPPGPAPECSDEGDVNGAGGIDISDVLYMVDYMFATPAGPAPVSCP